MMHISVVTASRAEYGLLKKLIQQLQSDNFFRVKVVVSGSHLDSETGNSIEEILKDGISIDEKISIQVMDQLGVDVLKTISHGISNFTDHFRLNPPELLMLMGDRYEMLSIAIPAFMLGIPIAHISGGELSLGSKDDVIRHILTKLATLHFVSADEHKRRVIQLGENPEMVFSVGEPGLDELKDYNFLPKQELEIILGRSLNRPVFLMTFHPSGINTNESKVNNDIRPLLSSLDRFPDGLIICSRPNSDDGNWEINQILEGYQAANKERFLLCDSLGRRVYLSLMKIGDLVIGNSSSGIVEAPLMGIPSVDVGDRQRGRLRGNSVIHASNTMEEIIKAINLAISDEFKGNAASKHSLYGNGNACKNICQILKGIDLASLKKRDFYDLTNP